MVITNDWTTANMDSCILERISKLLTCCVVISHAEDDKASLLHINTGTWWSNTEQGLLLVAMLHFKWIVLASSVWTNVTRTVILTNIENQIAFFSVDSSIIKGKFPEDYFYKRNLGLRKVITLSESEFDYRSHREMDYKVSLANPSLKYTLRDFFYGKINKNWDQREDVFVHVHV